MQRSSALGPAPRVREVGTTRPPAARRSFACSSQASSPAPAPASTSASASAPARVTLVPPAHLDQAWRTAQLQWLKLAVESPIQVAGTTFHLLGTCHHNPCNPSLVRAAAEAVAPDCVAVEASSTRLAVLTKACQDGALRDVLQRLAALPLEQCSLASHLSAQDLAAWHSALNAALRSSFCLPLDASEGLPHFALGHPRYSEELAAVHLASSRGGRGGLPLLAIDLPAGSELNEQAQAFDFSGLEYDVMGLRAMASEPGDRGAGQGRDLRAEFEGWRDAVGVEVAAAYSGVALSSGSGAEGQSLQSFVEGFVQGTLVPSALSPNQMCTFNVLDREAGPRAYEVVVEGRDRYMAERLRAVAEAKGLERVVKLGMGAGWSAPGRVLVVLGRSHVEGVRRLLQAAPSRQ